MVINKCDEPVTVTTNMQVPHLSIDWSHKFTSDEIVHVPGFLITMEDIRSAGVYVKVHFNSGGSQLNMKVSSVSTTGTAGGRAGSDLLPLSTPFSIRTDSVAKYHYNVIKPRTSKGGGGVQMDPP